MGAWLGVSLVACQGPEEYYRGGNPGQGGSAPTGAAGSFVTGAGGSLVTGTGGSLVTGAGGSLVTGTAGTSAGGTSGGGTTGIAGTLGAAGTTGTAGTVGTAGRGGAAGTTAGVAGRGGTTGAAGTMGSAGRGGTTGTGGRGGRGGSTGTAGTMGAAGAGANSCPLGGRLDCTSAGALELTPDGQVVDFSAAQWNDTTDRWCNARGLDGRLSSYAGMSSTAAASVDTTARNLELNLMVAAGQYAGGRVNFDSCVDARTFNSVQFTASVTGGSLTGCVWQVQIQTQDQRPTAATNPTGGTCTAATCERYPAATLAAATATATTFTVRFSSFDNPATSPIATASQISGLQWQVNSGNSGSGSCTVELRIDNVRFVTQ